MRVARYSSKEVQVSNKKSINLEVTLVQVHQPKHAIRQSLIDWLKDKIGQNMISAIVDWHDWIDVDA